MVLRHDNPLVQVGVMSNRVLAIQASPVNSLGPECLGKGGAGDRCAAAAAAADRGDECCCHGNR